MRNDTKLIMETWRRFLSEDVSLKNINELDESIFNAYFKKVYNYCYTIIRCELLKKLGKLEESEIFTKVEGNSQEDLYEKYKKDEVKNINEYNIEGLNKKISTMSDVDIEKFLRNIDYRFIPLEFSILWEKNCKGLEEINSRISNYKEYLKDFSGFMPKPFYGNVSIKQIKGDWYLEFEDAKYSYVNQ